MIKRQKAFEGDEKYLKGALHCHTTRSDGDITPNDLLHLYYENGYDFVSLTDHYVYNRINHAPEIPITIIPGCEGGGGIDFDKGFRTFHTVMIGRDDDTNGFAHDEKVPNGDAFAPNGHVTNQYDYQPYLDMIHAKGNLTIYCHPEWSSTPAKMFDKMIGNFAMEIWNTGCVVENWMDRDASYWDELLGQGNKIYGVATDDGHWRGQCCGGWVMVRSANNVDDILTALENGAFYSSCGPEIYDFYVEDGIAYIKCSPSSMIRFQADRHPTVAIRGDGITEARLDLEDDYNYIRATVTDADGKMAWTNPIYLD